MLYVIGSIFKVEFKETKTVALGRRREELQGNPRQGHGQQGGWVRKLKKMIGIVFFCVLFKGILFFYIIINIFTNILINTNQISGIYSRFLDLRLANLKILNFSKFIF